jgi:hypothetical protein
METPALMVCCLPDKMIKGQKINLVFFYLRSLIFKWTLILYRYSMEKLHKRETIAQRERNPKILGL